MKKNGKLVGADTYADGTNAIVNLDAQDIMAVSGGISQSTQIGSQMAFIGTGAGLYAAGIALTPIGAALFIGTSLALTGSYLYHNWP